MGGVGIVMEWEWDRFVCVLGIFHSRSIIMEGVVWWQLGHDYLLFWGGFSLPLITLGWHLYV